MLIEVNTVKNKKTLIALAAVLMMLCLAACGGAAKTETYVSDKGISVEMMPGMELADAEADGYDVFYEATTEEYCAMLAARDEFDAVDYPATMTIEEYADYYKQMSYHITDFEVDSNGNLYSTYQAGTDNNWFYYITVRKGTDTFWVINFICPQEEQDVFLPQFERWSNSIAVD